MTNYELEQELSCKQMEVEDLRQQLADKQQALSNVYELWAGIDGMPQPKDELGWYLFQLVEKMRDAAKEVMK
jgi:hypothetical protein